MIRHVTSKYLISRWARKVFVDPKSDTLLSRYPSTLNSYRALKLARIARGKRSRKRSLSRLGLVYLRSRLHVGSIARWKARDLLSIITIIEHFASYGWDVIRGNLSRRVSKGVVHFERKFQTEGASTNHYWCQKTRVIALSCGINIQCALFGFITKHACAVKVVMVNTTLHHTTDAMFLFRFSVYVPLCVFVCPLVWII